MARDGVILLRASLGIVFLWFGVLKFFPNLSPAQGLATRTMDALTFGMVPPAVSLPVLAAWVLLDREGIVRWLHPGTRDDEGVRLLVEQLRRLAPEAAATAK